VALTHKQLEAAYPGGPSVAYRAAAAAARRVLPGELGEVIALILEEHAKARDWLCEERGLNQHSWLVSHPAPVRLSAVLLEREVTGVGG
jgi:hypothetical protein